MICKERDPQEHPEADLVGEDDEEGENEVLREAAEYELHGTAKVTLLAIDRSMAAWARLMEKLPEEEEAILPLLARLDRLRKGLEAAVPRARAFVRPGLDSRACP